MKDGFRLTRQCGFQLRAKSPNLSYLVNFLLTKHLLPNTAFSMWIHALTLEKYKHSFLCLLCRNIQPPVSCFSSFRSCTSLEPRRHLNKTQLFFGLFVFIDLVIIIVLLFFHRRKYDTQPNNCYG